MTTSTTTTSTGWVCVDCLFLLANGETPSEMSEDETAAYLARIDHNTAGSEVTLGLVSSEHDSECQNVDHETGTWLGTTDCSCEQREFSWSACDLCGSHLGGSRDAVTFHHSS